MEIIVHDLSNLFRQLGMVGNVETIDAFLGDHRLSLAHAWQKLISGMFRKRNF